MTKREGNPHANPYADPRNPASAEDVQAVAWELRTANLLTVVAAVDHDGHPEWPLQVRAAAAREATERLGLNGATS